MTDEKRGKDVGRGTFERGNCYEEVGPDLGCLHDAWDTATGRPVLQLVPTELVEWRPVGPWRLSLLCEPHPTSVILRVEEAPESLSLTELTDILVFTTAAVTRVEGSPRLRAHLVSGLSLPLSVPPPAPSTGRALATGTGLLLGLGLGLLMSLSVSPSPLAWDGTSSASSGEDASALVELDTSTPADITYPLPKKPFRNQAVPPCATDRGAVEINEGCWVELAQKPPCFSDQAEDGGKCYLPVAKPQRLPQSTGR